MANHKFDKLIVAKILPKKNYSIPVGIHELQKIFASPGIKLLIYH